ncbi:hypothetical protein MRB53_038189 [Persea americana]|nr:hypothetical protein MRB53_038189 [Persea americana]
MPQPWQVAQEACLLTLGHSLNSFTTFAAPSHPSLSIPSLLNMSSFPFPNQQSYHPAILEAALQCLLILLEKGWKTLPPDLGLQLLMLLAFLVDDSTPAAKAQAPPARSAKSDDLQELGLRCLALVCRGWSAGAASANGKAKLEEMHIPALGHAITVALDCLVTSSSAQVQDAALGALNGLAGLPLERDLIAQFLARIVSSLTKVLTPSTKARRSWKLLKGCLQLLGQVLASTLADDNLYTASEDLRVTSATAAATGVGSVQLGSKAQRRRFVLL